MKPRACIVLPTYNERENVKVLIPLIFKISFNIPTHDLHVLVVDDNSPDGTQDAVRFLMDDYPNLHLLRGEKRGLGEAYKRGMSHAIESLHPELIFEMDADLQHDANLIPLFIILANHGFSLVIGSRFAPGGATPNFSLRRRIMSLVGNGMIRCFGGLPRIHDCTSGYRCIKADLIGKCDFSSLSTRGYSFQSSLLVELLRNGARVIEVPITFPDRVTGESKLSFRDQVEFLFNIIKIRFRRMGEFVKFCIVGSSGVLVNLGIYAMLTRFSGIHMEIASPIAIESAILWNFTFNNLWTFRKRSVDDSLGRKLIRFHLVASLAALTNYAILLALVHWWGVHDILANLFGITVGTFINYATNSMWTWRHGNSPVELKHNQASSTKPISVERTKDGSNAS